MTWTMSPVACEQLVLFPNSLDEAVPQNHLVRVLDEILRALDWSQFEAKVSRTAESQARAIAQCWVTCDRYGMAI